MVNGRGQLSGGWASERSPYPQSLPFPGLGTFGILISSGPSPGEIAGVRPLLDPLGQAAGWRSTLGRVSRATTIRTSASHGRGRGRDSPPSPFAPSSLPPSQTDTLPCRPAPDSDSGSGCSLQPPLRPRLPILWLFRWLSLRCPPNLGAPGPDSAGLPSPSAGIMRATGTLQVLGFLLSLARGSEMGNSQAGKPRGSPSRLEAGSVT